MAIFVIGYDFKSGRGESYTKLISVIKELGDWWHCLDSTWLISSELNAEQIRDYLWGFMYSDDKLLVASYGGNSAWVGAFDEGCRTWLHTHM